MNSTVHRMVFRLLRSDSTDSDFSTQADESDSSLDSNSLDTRFHMEWRRPPKNDFEGALKERKIWIDKKRIPTETKLDVEVPGNKNPMNLGYHPVMRKIRLFAELL